MINTEMLQETLNMFAFLAVELTILFLLISYLVGVLQEYIPPEKIQSILSAKKGKGYIIAGFLGAITPFCSCSTIPFLKGLLRAKAGFGTMMVFLFASPLLNPIIIGLFAVTFGLQVTVFYFVMAMGVSIIAGYTLEKLGFEQYIKPEAYIQPEAKGCGANSGCGQKKAPVSKWKKIWDTTWADFKTVLPYLIGGIALGSIIYGFMPTEFVASIASFTVVLLGLTLIGCGDSKPKPESNPKKTKLEQQKENLLSSIDSLTKLIDKEPDRASLYIERAELWINNRMNIPANHDIEKALELEPENEKYLLAFGNHNTLLNDTRKAKEAWTKCSELFPENISCRIKLAELYFRALKN